MEEDKIEVRTNRIRRDCIQMDLDVNLLLLLWESAGVSLADSLNCAGG